MLYVSIVYFSWLYTIFIVQGDPVFMHLPGSVLLGCFYFLVVVSNAAMNIDV